MFLSKLYIKIFFLVTLFSSFSACTTLHHYQIGNIDQNEGDLKPFSIKLSELGFDAAGTVAIASVISKDYQTSKSLEEASILLFYLIWDLLQEILYTMKTMLKKLLNMFMQLVLLEK